MRSTENLVWKVHANSMKCADDSRATVEQGLDRSQLRVTIFLYQEEAIC